MPVDRKLQSAIPLERDGVSAALALDRGPDPISDDAAAMCFR